MALGTVEFRMSSADWHYFDGRITGSFYSQVELPDGTTEEWYTSVLCGTAKVSGRKFWAIEMSADEGVPWGQTEIQALEGMTDEMVIELAIRATHEYIEEALETTLIRKDK